MDLFEAIKTTRAMRRLDPGRDVSDADIRTIVEAALKGPSGGNSQPVRWLVVRDAGLRQQLGDIYRAAWQPVGAMYRSRTRAGSSTERVLNSADHLGEHMGDAPVIIIPCAPGQADASVYGAVQNLMLAARALGLGTTLTTVHRTREADVRKILGIPDDVRTWAMIPVGYPLGRWGEARRLAYEKVTYWDRWEQPPPS